MEKIKERSERILAMNPKELEGFYFPSREEAIKSALSILQDANGKKIVYFDIDDTLFRSERWIRWALNRKLRGGVEGFRSVNLQQVQNAGGRYFQVEDYQNAAGKLGRQFYELFTTEFATNPKLHSYMTPHHGALEFQKKLVKDGYIVGGYPTARPHEIGIVTAASLQAHGFSKAPVIDVVADSGSPEHAKVFFFKEVILPNIPTGVKKPVYFVDDHPATAIEIQKACGGAIIPLVPIVPRNRNKIPQLETHNIKYGTFEQLAEHLRNIGV